MYDCHIHTKFSTDSTINAEEACEAAIRLGLDGIAFTDHLDYDYPIGGTNFLFDFGEYISHISSVSDKYAGKLKVLKAIEAGIQPHVIEDTMKVINSHPFDYVLASVHVIDHMDPYTGNYYKEKAKLEAYRRYLEEIFYMINNLESFDMVGHFEYIIRYAPYDDRTLRYADFSDIFDAILRKLIEQGRGFELNTSTFRNQPTDTVYDKELLKRYRELGGELICLASDAHRIENIAIKFDYYSQIIRDAGFRYTVHFENRKPIYDRL